MKVETGKVDALRAMLEDYKQKHGEIVKNHSDALNWNCGVCGYSCSGRCDGTGQSGSICWRGINYK